LPAVEPSGNENNGVRIVFNAFDFVLIKENSWRLIEKKAKEMMYRGYCK
jgi:hypothetical protein